MGSDEEERVPKRKPHAVCIPFPAQGHVKPMMNLAKLLHSKGFHVTFVNSEFNHRRLLNSGAIAADIPSFRFEAVPDGLPPTEAEITQDIPSLCHSTPIHTLAPFTALLRRLNSDSVVPPVTCVISDGCMSFTLDSADELGIPEILFWTTSACGFLGYLHYEELRQRGLTPLKDESCVSNGYLDTVVDWIPGMSGIRLKDLPTFLRTTDPDDIMFNFVVGETRRAQRGKAVILNTFEELESGVVSEIRSILKPPVYTIGALHELVDQLVPRSAASESINPSLWKEDTTCLEWLEGQEAGSVLYVNFGSITVMTSEQLREFAWGLAGSGRAFLWVIRADLVGGESAVVPAEFEEETRERGMVARWCPQERVLKHAAVGGFLTHSGWNSTLESLCVGVPMLCWPFFAEQQTNCWFACRHWAVAMEIDSAAHRHEIARLVTQLMDGDTGKRMTATALRWKGLAHEAVSPGGTTASNFDRLLQQLLSYN